MTRTQRRTVRTHAAIAAIGAAVTAVATVVALPLMYGLDSAAYLALIGVGLLATFAGIQLASPKRRRSA